MNGFCALVMMLGLVVAVTAAAPYPSKQLRIRQVVVPSAVVPDAGEAEEEPPSRFEPFDFNRPNPDEKDPAEIVEEAEEAKPEGEEPFIINPEPDQAEEEVAVEGAEDEEKKDEEEKKEEEEEKGGDEKVKLPKVKENSGEEEEDKPKHHHEHHEHHHHHSHGSGERSAEAEIVAADEAAEESIDPVVLGSHDHSHHGKAELVPKSAPKVACHGKEFQQRVEAVIAELHEIKELCCKIEAVGHEEDAD